MDVAKAGGWYGPPPAGTNGKNVLGVVNGERHRPEKQQLCLFEVSAGLSFLEGVLGALDRIFLTPLMTHVW